MVCAPFPSPHVSSQGYLAYISLNSTRFAARKLAVNSSSNRSAKVVEVPMSPFCLVCLRHASAHAQRDLNNQ